MSEAKISPEVQLSEIKTIQNVPPESSDIVKCRDASEQGRGPDGTQDEHDTEGDAIRIHILDMKHINKSARNANKDYMVYEYLVGGRETKYPASVWVQQMGSEDDMGGLQYDPKSRNPFLLLVFIIVFIMLAITAIFVSFVINVEPMLDFFSDYGKVVAIPAMIGMLMLSYGISCSACCRTFPCNIIILVLAVVCMSIIAAYVTHRIKSSLIFFALLATAGTVVVCMALACTSYDFTSWTLYVIAIAAVFFIISLSLAIAALATGTYIKGVHLVLLIIGSILNVVILIIQLQMILGGKSIEISEYDYALAAFMLYTSIVDIFLKIVQMLNILDHF